MGKIKCLYCDKQLDEYNKIEKTCKACGKKYFIAWTKSGYSDFCSSKCSRSFSTKIKREEINEKVSLKFKEKHLPVYEQKYYDNPKYCLNCKKIIPYIRRKCKTCGKKCETEILSKKAKNLLKEGKLNTGGYFKNSSRGRCGYYQGIWCDSTYELAFLIYNLEHNVSIKRCEEYFTYTSNGKQHKYFPDFIIGDEIIEIKNYWRKEVDLKINAVKEKGKTIKVLYQTDLEPMMQYIDKKFNVHHKGKRNNYHTLYDKVTNNRTNI